MNHSYDAADWPEVSESQFIALLETFDYRRDGWNDVIVYLERHPPHRAFAYELRKPLRYLIHPGLVAHPDSQSPEKA